MTQSIIFVVKDCSVAGMEGGSSSTFRIIRIFKITRHGMSRPSGVPSPAWEGCRSCGSMAAAVLRTGILNMAPMIAAIAMMNDSCVRQEMIDELKLTHLRQVRFTTSTCLVK